MSSAKRRISLAASDMPLRKVDEGTPNSSGVGSGPPVTKACTRWASVSSLSASWV